MYKSFMLPKCFNVSVEGQPLQHLTHCIIDHRVNDVSIPLSRDSHCNVCINHKMKAILVGFQSLCRGTAIATSVNVIIVVNIRMFQSLCRGTAIATRGDGGFGSTGK